MSVSPLSRVVLDTNAVFEGLTSRDSAAGLLIDAWSVGQLYVCVSNALAYEYVDVLSRKLSKARWKRLKPVLGALLSRAHYVALYYTWRPISPDPGDEHVIDCAMNAGAMVVPSNTRHFRLAREALGLRVVTAVEAVIRLDEQFALE
jgi:predicted nucleic acid-binding protein